MKQFRSFVLSIALTALTLSVCAQPGITKVTVLTDSIQEPVNFPVLSVAPAIVHLPIVGYYSETIPVVEVQISGHPYRFVFDTGCSYSSFNSRYVSQSPGDSIVYFGTTQGVNKLYNNGLVKVADFEAGGLKADELVMMTSNLNDKDFPVHGIIGLSLVRDYDLLFDWPNREILLVNPDSTGGILDKQYKIIESIPVSYYTDPYYIGLECQVNGKPLRLHIDTGAYKTLLPDDVSNRGKSHLAKKPVRKKKGIGYMVQYKEFIEDKVTITLGNQKYRKVKVLPGENTRSERYENAGQLGNNVLQRQPILISMNSEKLLILKHRR
ncbi:MAG: aspartyl protease family protein [Bacteroidaceae bacterium]|nr:aspartyl protease family protein [Bacteroidaceae bacterium]